MFFPCIEQELGNVSVKVQRPSILGFVDHMGSVATNCLCCFSAKAARGDTWINAMAVFQQIFIYNSQADFHL